MSLVISSRVLIAVSCGVVCIGVGVVQFTGARDLGEGLTLSGVLLACQGSYVIAQAEFTRRARYASIMELRLSYGIWLFGLTFIAVLGRSSGAVLVLATCIAYIVGVTTTAWRQVGLRRTVRGLTVGIGLSDVIAEVRSGRVLVASFTVGSLSAQVGALATVAMGSLAAPWAIVTRLSSGFQTVGGQLVGPAIDIAVSQGRRARDAKSLRSGVQRGVIWGLFLAVGFLASAAAAVVSVPYGWDSSSGGRAFVVAVVGYGGGSVLLSPIGRLLGMGTGGRARLIWETVRAIGSIGVVVFGHGPSLLTGLGVVGICAASSYLFLVLRSSTWGREALR